LFVSSFLYTWNYRQLTVSFLKNLGSVFDCLLPESVQVSPVGRVPTRRQISGQYLPEFSIACFFLSVSMISIMFKLYCINLRTIACCAWFNSVYSFKLSMLCYALMLLSRKCVVDMEQLFLCSLAEHCDIYLLCEQWAFFNFVNLAVCICTHSMEIKWSLLSYMLIRALDMLHVSFHTQLLVL
jgi:hypothetical protein